MRISDNISYYDAGKNGKSGLISRVQSETDKRENTLFLTEKAIHALKARVTILYLMMGSIYYKGFFRGKKLPGRGMPSLTKRPERILREGRPRVFVSKDRIQKHEYRPLAALWV